MYNDFTWKGLIWQEHSKGLESNDNSDKCSSTSLRGSMRMMSLWPNFKVSKLNNPMVKSPLTTFKKIKKIALLFGIFDYKV